MSPTHCTGRSPAIRAVDHAARGIPAQITAIVPTTGRSTTSPGNTSGTRNDTIGTMMSARPIHDTAARRPSRPFHGTAGHDREDAADAELPGAGEGREVREIVVLRREHDEWTNDSAVTTPSTASTRRAGRAPRRVASQSAMIMSSGQTR